MDCTEAKRQQLENDCKKISDLAEVLRKRGTVPDIVWKSIAELPDYLRNTFGSTPLTQEEKQMAIYKEKYGH